MLIKLETKSARVKGKNEKIKILETFGKKNFKFTLSKQY